jgi:MFS family permease
MTQDEDNLEPLDLMHSIDSIGNEQSPLIRSDSDGCDNGQDSRWKSSALRPLGMMITCFLLNILMEFGLFLITIPLSQVLEEIICRGTLLPEIPATNDPRCKDKAVQSELSLIRGWQATFDIIPGLLTALPYGLMADKYGRELVLGLSVLGGALTSTFNVLVCASHQYFILLFQDFIYS